MYLLTYLMPYGVYRERSGRHEYTCLALQTSDGICCQLRQYPSYLPLRNRLKWLPTVVKEDNIRGMVPKILASVIDELRLAVNENLKAAPQSRKSSLVECFTRKRKKVVHKCKTEILFSEKRQRKETKGFTVRLLPGSLRYIIKNVESLNEQYLLRQDMLTRDKSFYSVWDSHEARSFSIFCNVVKVN